jgi:SAM-dependent methyltransferase
MLELLGGAGHSSALVGALYPDLEIVLTDYDFVNLCLARRFVAPNAVSACVDAEAPLPFAAGSFDGIYCLDGLHYVRSKSALLSEVDRLVSSDGVWLFAHMHNASVANVNSGTPLDAPAYAWRFTFGEHRMLAETEVLRQFQEGDSLDLTTQPALAALESSNALTLFGARSPRLWRKHGDFANRLRRSGVLALNPLYRLEKTPDGAVANAVWPSDFLRAECTATPVLRDSVPIGARLLEQLSKGDESTASRDVDELIRSFALVPLPRCYGRVAWRDFPGTKSVT